MEYLENRIDWLEGELRDLEIKLEEHNSILRRLAKAIKHQHDDDCAFNKSLRDMEYKPFSDLNNLSKWCICKNKYKHHKRCLPFLEKAFEEKFCKCGFYEIKKIFGDIIEGRIAK